VTAEGLPLGVAAQPENYSNRSSASTPPCFDMESSNHLSSEAVCRTDSTEGSPPSCDKYDTAAACLIGPTDDATALGS
jgi:hypothetical protein